MRYEELKKQYDFPEYAEFYERFLKNIPAAYMPYLYKKVFLAGEHLITSLQRSDTVYFLIKGKLFVVEDRIQNQPCIFTELKPVEIVGDYELFSEMEDSYATLVAARKCECLAIPAKVYMMWMTEDAPALLYRTKLLMKQLGGQNAANRQYFFMDYITRCASLILNYALTDISEIVTVELTREVLAAKVGCSLRTCHRIVKELEEKDMITITRGKIRVSPRQRIKLSHYMEMAMEAL